MQSSKEISIREIDNKVEYVSTKVVNSSKSNDKSVLYQKFLQREEFKRPTTNEIVLDEDEYLRCLEEIIQREYFPQLYKINKDKQLLKKIERAKSVTENRINIIDNLEKSNIDYLNDISSSGEVNDSKINLNNLNVDSFCIKYSSDELESLKDIIHIDNKKRLEKYFWIYEQAYQANENVKKIKEYTEQYISLPCEGKKHFEIPRIITADSDAKNSLFFPPIYSSTNGLNELETKKIAIQPSFENNLNFSTNLSIESKQTLKENTRLPENFVENIVEKHSNKMKRKIFDAYENSDVVKLLKEMEQIETNSNIVKHTPIINGYKLVKEPKAEDFEKIPIFTWGEIASTPNLLNNNSNFSIPDTPVRENIAHNLANKNLLIKRHRDNKTETKNLHTVRSNYKKYDLTPTAMKLLNSVQSSTSKVFNSNSSNLDLEKTPSLRKSTPVSLYKIKSHKKNEN